MHARRRKFREAGGKVRRAVLATCICLTVSPARAADEQDSCFCLVHSSGAILRGCFAYQARTDFYATAVCTDPETGKTSEQLITNEWQRISSGEDRCNPCRRQARETASEVPRGDEGKGSPSSPQSSLPAGQKAKP